MSRVHVFECVKKLNCMRLFDSIEPPVQHQMEQLVIPALSKEEEERMEHFGGGELLPFHEPAPAVPVGRVLSPEEVSLNPPSPRVPQSRKPSVEHRDDSYPLALQSLDWPDEMRRLWQLLLSDLVLMEKKENACRVPPHKPVSP